MGKETTDSYNKLPNKKRDQFYENNSKLNNKKVILPETSFIEKPQYSNKKLNLKEKMKYSKKNIFNENKLCDRINQYMDPNSNLEYKVPRKNSS